MRNHLHHRDSALRSKLQELTNECSSYWSYSSRSRSDEAYDYFQYPAMMVPGMLNDLIRVITEVNPAVSTVFDPFAGSGSVLTGAMMNGLSFFGTDVNPLAILLCKVKAGPYRAELLEQRGEDLLDCIESDPGTAEEPSFPNLAKWFTAKSIKELSIIRTAIRSEPNRWCRQFFWVSLAETVRLSSNSRTSTYKLHIRDCDDLQRRKRLSPKAIFEGVLAENLLKYSGLSYALNSCDLLNRGKYSRPLSIELADARAGGLLRQADLMITSPPYGDNTSTVPYGQHSFLPLQWIDLTDIDKKVSPDCLSSTHWIDSRSLGGNRKRAMEQAGIACAHSPTLRTILNALARHPRDRRNRVAAFSQDLHGCVAPSMNRLKKNAYMVWVVGNRRVGGLEVPTSTILREFLEANGAIHVCTTDRNIPTKRMAVKNSTSETMRKENILIFRKG
jgi:DNA methylase